MKKKNPTKKDNRWNSTKNQYTYFGIIFGLFFPLFASLFESFEKLGSISLENLIIIQLRIPLLWIIDTAPFVLGFLARVLGAKQEITVRVNLELKESNEKLKYELLKNQSIENSLRHHIEIYTNDLNSAKLVQEYLLPEIPDSREWKIAYQYLPLNPVGGDLISLVKLEEGGLSILICDVVGHGISAALITSLIKVLSNKNCRIYATKPKQYLDNLNEEVNHYLPDDYYVTGLYGHLRIENGKARLTFSRAGHPCPYIYSARNKQTTLIEISGLPMGLTSGTLYQDITIELEKGDRIFLITDGLLEAREKDGKALGVNRFKEIITDACQIDQNLDESLSRILGNVKAFSEEGEYRDDCLILGIEIL